MRAVLALVMVLLFLAGGCRSANPSPQSTRPAADLTSQQYFDSVRAAGNVPAGWLAEPLKQTSAHTHQVWLSPSRQTAYGIIHFSLPLPVGTEIALWGFLSEMRRTEGQAELLEKQWDPNLKQLRFVAEGGQYRVRTNLVVRGFEGWAIYAGTIKDDAINADELLLAEQARDSTEVRPR